MLLLIASNVLWGLAVLYIVLWRGRTPSSSAAKPEPKDDAQSVDPDDDEPVEEAKEEQKEAPVTRKRSVSFGNLSEKRKKDLEHEIKELQGRYNRLQSEREQAKVQLEKTRAKLAGLTQKTSKEYTKALERKNENEAEIAKLQSQFKACKKRCDALKAQVATESSDASQEHSQRTQQLREAEKTWQEKKTKLKEGRREVESVKRQINGIRSKLDHAQAQISHLQDDIATQKERHRQLQLENDMLQDEIDDIMVHRPLPSKGGRWDDGGRKGGKGGRKGTKGGKGGKRGGKPPVKHDDDDDGARDTHNDREEKADEVDNASDTHPASDPILKDEPSDPTSDILNCFESDRADPFPNTADWAALSPEDPADFGM